MPIADEISLPVIRVCCAIRQSTKAWLVTNFHLGKATPPFQNTGLLIDDLTKQGTIKLGKNIGR